jgi:hypothetical protein
MIWVEVLSRQRDVAERFRIAGPEARIGRAYDNDVIVDDPYVAAHHLRIFRDESGQLVAEDDGSANGTFLDRGKDCLTRVNIDGTKPIRIGQTLLRVRESNHAVEPERLARPERGIAPIVGIAVLGLAIVGIDALKIWLTQTTDPRLSSYLSLLMIIAAVLAWAGLWALLSRILSGHPRFVRNLLIALAGLLLISVYNEVAQIAAFAWTWPAANTYQYVVVWCVLAGICFLHLREVGHARLWLKGAIVATVLVTAIAAQALQQSEAFSDSGRQNTTRLLMPPAFRAVSVRDENAFSREVTELRVKLDRDRSEALPAEVVR